LIELLVTISIIAVLMALILPAIHNARESSRRIQCANRMRNIALAVLNDTELKRRFPASAWWGGPDKDNPGPHHNWVVEILPWIDRRDLADRWNHEQLLTDAANQQLAETHIAVLVCPSDISTNGQGDLSFAVNGGIGESTFHNDIQDCIVDPFGHVLDLNGNGQVCVPPDTSDGDPSDRDIYKRLGLFFNENLGFDSSPGYAGTKRHHRPGSVTDGMSNTLLLTENIRTGYDPYNPGTNWATADSRRTKVFFSHRVCTSNVCSVGNVDLSRANADDHAVNSGIRVPEGEAPWPNSFHPAGVNVAFADGRVQFLNQDIDGLVYYNLFTPQGTELRGTPLDGGVSSDSF
jgi:prepilin-type processing-associated H-X9-DG protein